MLCYFTLIFIPTNCSLKPDLHYLEFDEVTTGTLSFVSVIVNVGY